MKTPVPLLAATLTALSAPVLAQSDSELRAKLQACSKLEGGARRDCVDKLLYEIPAPPKSPPAAKRPQAPVATPAPAKATSTPAKATVADTWFVTETTSPLDYSPIAIATATAAAGADGANMSLSVQCRGGRTDIVVAGAAIQRGPGDASVTYMVNAGAPVPVAVGAAPSGKGLAFRLDAVSLIASLPNDGDMTVRVAGRQGGAVEGKFSLAGLAKARSKIAAPCKWPAAARAAPSRSSDQ
ncbi:MAG TPA: hypothetical protein VGF58_05075 [Burkholderiales bacterium]